MEFLTSKLPNFAADLREHFDRQMEENILLSVYGSTIATEGVTVSAEDIRNDTFGLLKQLEPVPALPELRKIPWPQVPVRSNKNKRIHKKWLKKYGTRPDTAVDDGTVFQFYEPEVWGMPPVPGMPRPMGMPGRKRPVMMAYPFTYQKIVDALRKEGIHI